MRSQRKIRHPKENKLMLIRSRLIVFTVPASLLAAGCGVKAAPTPVLSAPPSPLQQETKRRAAEAENEKELKNKEKKALEPR